MNILKIILTSLFLFLILPVFGVNEVFAQTDCNVIKNSESPTHGAEARITGNDCSGIKNRNGTGVGPGQFSDSYQCLGSSGYRYLVTYCRPDGCEETYPEKNESKAPAACNRSDEEQSEISKVFGKIDPPTAIQNLGFGATGVGIFLTNLVRLIYVIAAVVLVFMILWGAFDWLTSEGNKEKLEHARNKLINAIVGILIFAAAFAVIQILGQFTGFKFFQGQQGVIQQQNP